MPSLAESGIEEVEGGREADRQEGGEDDDDDDEGGGGRIRHCSSSSSSREKKKKKRKTAGLPLFSFLLGFFLFISRGRARRPQRQRARFDGEAVGSAHTQAS